LPDFEKSFGFDKPCGFSKVYACYISQDMRVGKVLVSKSDLQGHLRSLVLALFDRPYTITH